MSSRESDGSFERGVKAYRAREYAVAIEAFTAALEEKSAKTLIILDSRAAAYEAVDDVKAALKDAKGCIDIAPNAFQGYLRSAKLFQRIDQLPRAKEVLLLGLSRIPATASAKLDRLQFLLTTVTASIRAHARHDPLSFLPLEIWARILSEGVEIGGADHPLIPAAVSKSWREATLACHEVWGILQMRERTSKKKAVEWVKRSRGRLTEIRLDGVGGGSSFWGEWAQIPARNIGGSEAGIDLLPGRTPIAQTLLPSLVNVKSLKLHGLSTMLSARVDMATLEAARKVVPLWASTCAHLRHLDVRAKDDYGGARYGTSSDRIDLGFLMDSARGLETIKLRGIRLSVPSAIDQRNSISLSPQPFTGSSVGSCTPVKSEDATTSLTLRRRRQLGRLGLLEVSHCFIETNYEWVDGRLRYTSALDEALSNAHGLQVLRLIGNLYTKRGPSDRTGAPLPTVDYETISTRLPSVAQYVEVLADMRDVIGHGHIQMVMAGRREPLLVQRLELPNLQCAHIHGTIVFTSLPVGEMVRILRNTMTSGLTGLQSLNWGSSATTGRELIEILPELSSLRHLELVDMTMGLVSAFASLVPLLCPRLDSLMLKRMTGSASPLLSVVKTRRGGCSTQAELDASLEKHKMELDEGDNVLPVPKEPKHAAGTAEKRKVEDDGEEDGREESKRLKSQSTSSDLETGDPQGSINGPSAITTLATAQALKYVPEEEPGSSAKASLVPETKPISAGTGNAIKHVRIRSIVVQDCENFEKEAEEWLKKTVPDFSIVWPAREKARYRDRGGA